MSCNIHKIGFILIMTILLITLGASCQMQGRTDQKNSTDITPREAYSLLLNTSMEMAYLDTMIGLSQWDQDISMPQNATKYRAKAQSYMEDLKNKKWIDRNSEGFSLLPITAAIGLRSKPQTSGCGTATTTRG